MQDNSKYSDSRFSRTLDSAVDRSSIMQTGLEHLVVKDFMRSSVFAVIDHSLPYQGFYYDEIPTSELKGRVPAGSAFMNNSYSPENIELMNSNYELRLKKPEEELKIVDECIMIFQNNPTIEDIQNSRRIIIDKLEDLTMKIVEGKREKGSEMKDIISNRLFLELVLNCFSKEGNTKALSELKRLQKAKQNEINLIQNEITSIKKTQNFRKESFGVYR